MLKMLVWKNTDRDCQSHSTDKPIGLGPYPWQPWLHRSSSWLFSGILVAWPSFPQCSGWVRTMAIICVNVLWLETNWFRNSYMYSMTALHVPVCYGLIVKMLSRDTQQFKKKNLWFGLDHSIKRTCITPPPPPPPPHTHYILHPWQQFATHILHDPYFE